jgi:hypothetical protein
MADDDDLRRLAADPTPLTTAMLLREIANLSEKIGIRIDAVEKAQEVFRDNLTRVPTEVQKEVGHLRELHDQMFGDIMAQLIERSDRRVSEKQAAEKALDAALVGQKESTTKSQAATEKQIDSLKEALDKSIGTVKDQIAVINGRLDRGEAGPVAVRERNADRRLDSGLLVSLGSLLVAAVAIVVAIVRHI